MAAASAEEKTNDKPVLRLGNGIQAHTLSGPMSYAYLKPTEEAYERYKQQGLDLPLVLLFGDVHFSQQGTCPTPCTPPDCLSIATKEFLQGVDALSTNTPIDFYTESSESYQTESHRGQGVLFESFLDKLSLYCHHASKRSDPDYAVKCSARNIRWHYGDLRYMFHYKESIPTMMFTYLRYLKRNIVGTMNLHQLKKWITTFSADNGFPSYTAFLRSMCPYEDPKKSLAWYEAVLAYSSSYATAVWEIASLFPDNSVLSPKLYTHLTKAMRRLDLMKPTDTLPPAEILPLFSDAPPSHQRILSQYVAQLTPTSSDQATVAQCILAAYRYVERAATWITDMLKEDTPGVPSGLMKQMKKVSVAELRDPMHWRQLYVESILFSFRGFSRVIQHLLDERINANDNVQPVRQIRQMIHWQDDVIDRRMCLELSPFLIQLSKGGVESALVQLNFPLLDMYTLLRMWKKPTEGVSSTLALGFFGNAHTQNLIRLLQVHGYRMVMQKENDYSDPTLRCLSFDQNLWLDKEVTEHHLQRTQPENVMRSHRSRLAEENRRRQNANTMSSAIPLSVSNQRIRMYSKKQALNLPNRKENAAYNSDTNIDPMTYRFPNEANEWSNVNWSNNNNNNATNTKKGGTRRRQKRKAKRTRRSFKI